jgi:hypothetical protein
MRCVPINRENCDRKAYPPVWRKQWEVEVVHDAVRMRALVRADLYANAEALQAQVEIRTHSALDADGVADVFIAVVAMKEGPAYQESHTMDYGTSSYGFSGRPEWRRSGLKQQNASSPGCTVCAIKGVPDALTPLARPV